MPIDLTPTDTFPAPKAPHGSDSRSDAVMQTILQTYADRTQYAALRAAENDARLTVLEDALSSATFQIAAGSASPVALSVLSTGANIGNPDGYSIVSGNQIECPSGGRYIVTWQALVTISSATAGVMGSLNLEVGGSGICFAPGVRGSTTTSELIPISAAYAIKVSSTPSASRIKFTPYATAGTLSISSLFGDQFNVVSVAQVA